MTMEQTIPEGTTEKVDIGWEDGYLRMADVMERKFRVPRTETASWCIVDHHYWTEISTRRPDYRIRRP